jgi:hypothetical protein
VRVFSQQSNPADIKGLCGNGYSAMEGNITHVCSGSALTDAYNAYSSTCLVAGVTVCMTVFNRWLTEFAGADEDNSCAAYVDKLRISHKYWHWLACDEHKHDYRVRNVCFLLSIS